MSDDDPFEPTRTTTSNVVAARLRDSGREWVDAKCEKFGVARSEVLKAALAFANTHDHDFNQLIEQRKESI